MDENRGSWILREQHQQGCITLWGLAGGEEITQDSTFHLIFSVFDG